MVDPVPLALTFAKLAISKGEKESFLFVISMFF